MPTAIGRDDVRRLVEQGARLVEVLPAAAYEDEHLPEAMNIPLKELDRRAPVELRRDQPVIVYCHDYQWDLSARAAARLESLGFGRIYRYTPGKADWFASGLPRAGKLAAVPRIGDLARRDVPTCHLDERIDDVRARIRAADGDLSVVVNDAGVVLGLVTGRALDRPPASTVEQVMEPGPQTFRPDVPVAAMVDYLRERGLASALVTTGDGVLVGLFWRADGERVLERYERIAEDGS